MRVHEVGAAEVVLAAREDAARTERQEEALVGIDDDRVGALDAGELALATRARSRGSGHAHQEERRAALEPSLPDRPLARWRRMRHVSSLGMTRRHDAGKPARASAFWMQWCTWSDA